MRAAWVLALVALGASSSSATELAPEVEAARLAQLATIFEVQSLLERMRRQPWTSGSVEQRLERMQWREDALSELDRVALVIDATLARLAREQAAADNARNTLNAHHARTVVTWSIAATLMGSGVAIVGTSLQFDGATQAKLGNGLAIGGAALASAFSIVALTRKNRGSPPYAIETNLLAPLFGRAPLPDSRLPEVVWRYLDTTLAGERTSVRAQLIAGWAEAGVLPRARSPGAEGTIDLLTRPISPRQSIAADVLGVRAHMLDDLRARIAGMKIDLQALVQHVRAREG